MKECPACRRCFPDEINHCPQDGDATTPSLMGEPILDARYQLERRLGQGGMGVVFQARHIFLKTPHAIKIILPDLVGNDPMLVTRFRQEALAAAAIRHPNIIAVTDFGVVRSTMPFLVMEFVKGRSLQDILSEEKRLSPARAMEIMAAMGAGVAAAHRQNIVHRDLKPLNVMIQDGVPVSEGLKILDFGLAKIKSGELLGSFVQAKTSGLMGSPFYMAPEQWSDEEPDARADIYSLGIIFYQMLSGDVPFKGSSMPSIMKKHLTTPPPSFQSLGVQINPAIEAAVLHSLEKEINDRTPSVEHFLRELSAAISAVGANATTVITSGIDPNKTIVDASPPASSTNPPGFQQTGEVEKSFDSMAGTISSSALDQEAQDKLAASRAAFERDQEARERAAREELDRETDFKLKQQQDTKRRLQLEEELEKEKRDRDETERAHRAQLDRVARQASELEERLARLSTSMPPPPAVDPEATQVRDPSRPAVSGGESFSRPIRSELSIPFPEETSEGFAEKLKNKNFLIAGGAVLLVLLIGLSVGAYFLFRSKQVPPTVTTNDQQQPADQTHNVKADLVEIPGGTFLMGRDDGPPQERPPKAVTVQTFYMDRTEVTNEEYAEFARDMHHPAPPQWANGQVPPGRMKWPVTNVSSQDAEVFAAWRSKRDGVTYRLPTEEEWEFAARSGGDYKLFPWGDAWEDHRAVVREAEPQAVGSFPDGANRWGVLDLIGNVWEWTSSKASLYPGNTVQIPPATANWVVARGGSYSSDPNDHKIPVSATYRDWYDPNSKLPNFGFRLVRAPR